MRARGPNFKWTDERDAELTRMVLGGLTTDQAARKLGVTRSAANGRAARLGLRFGGGRRIKWTPEMDGAVVDGAKSGKTIAEVAAAIGATSGAVSGRASALDVRFGNARLKPPAPAPTAVMTWGVGKNGVRAKPSIPLQSRDEPLGVCTIHTLKASSCRWPIGETYCGKDKTRGSYCTEHALISYGEERQDKARAGKELIRSLRRWA